MIVCGPKFYIFIRTNYDEYKTGPADSKKKRTTATSKKTAKLKKLSNRKSNVLRTIAPIPVPAQFECKKCKKFYKEEKYLKAHNQAKHDKDLLAFNCPQCESTFSTKYLLKYHCRNKHQRNLTDEDWKTCTEAKKNTRSGEYWLSYRNLRIFSISQTLFQLVL